MATMLKTVRPSRCPRSVSFYPVRALRQSTSAYFSAYAR